jgi:hypothetical protein
VTLESLAPELLRLTVSDDDCVLCWAASCCGRKFTKKSNLTAGGCWSNTRPGVFFTARQDGVLDVWDLHFKHQAPTLQVRCNAELPLLLAGGARFCLLLLMPLRATLAP